jgi:hypothetical protein
LRAGLNTLGQRRGEKGEVVPVVAVGLGSKNREMNMGSKKKFFGQDSSAAVRTRAKRSDRALYLLTDDRGKPVTIAVDCLEGGGNVPRDAAALGDLAAKLDMGVNWAQSPR